MHLFRGLVWGVAIAAAAPAVGTPPPIGVPVLILSLEPEAQAVGEAYMAYLSAKGLFSRMPLAAPQGELWACLQQKTSQASCIRKAAGWKPKGAAVVVLVSGESRQKWQCIGVASKPARHKAQTISVDVEAGLFGSEAKRVENRRHAAQCVISAGSESGW